MPFAYTACDNGTFGLNCSETCGQCIDYCNIADGMCPTGCLPGWKGNMCMQGKMPFDKKRDQSK